MSVLRNALLIAKPTADSAMEGERTALKAQLEKAAVIALLRERPTPEQRKRIGHLGRGIRRQRAQ